MPGERPPGDFGRKLRDARERRGVSLRQIASATKISVSVLEALERNDISRLPGGIFSRAFVRSYAVEVGLDPETTIQEFVAQFPHDSVTAGHHATQPIEDNEAVESERRMASTFLRLILISIPIAIAVLYFGTAGRFARATPDGPAPAPPPAPPAVAPSSPQGSATAAANPPESAAADAPPAAAEAPPPMPVADASGAPADRLAISLAVARPCWISATVDGEKKIERLLQPGDDETLDVARELVLTAGDAGAVTLSINGATAKPLGSAGQVVTKHVNLTNFKDLLPPR